MKKFGKSILGVTLLEIMLVLAVAAMIIVMSVRYYQSATSSQQANSTLQMIQGIAAAADGLAQGTGTYSSVTTATVGPLMPGGLTTITTAWGTTVTITGAASTYTVTIKTTPAQVCALLASRLAGNPKFTNMSACGTTAADFVYTYNATT